MSNQVELESEITQLKKMLEHTAKQNKYNFNHPSVIAISQKLDHLIIKVMKEKQVSWT